MRLFITNDGVQSQDSRNISAIGRNFRQPTENWQVISICIERSLWRSGDGIRDGRREEVKPSQEKPYPNMGGEVHNEKKSLRALIP